MQNELLTKLLIFHFKLNFKWFELFICLSIYQRLGSIYQNENEKTDSKILRNINIKQTFFL